VLERKLTVDLLYQQPQRELPGEDELFSLYFPSFPVSAEVGKCYAFLRSANFVFLY